MKRWQRGGHGTLVCETMDKVEDFTTERLRNQRTRTALGNVAKYDRAVESHGLEDESVLGTEKRGQVSTDLLGAGK